MQFRFGPARALYVAATLAVFPAAAAAQGTCPTTVDDAQFAASADFEQMVKKLNSFGLRTPGSPEHEAMLRVLESELKAIPGLNVANQNYELTQWEPTPKAADGRGRDMGAAGSLALVGARGDIPIPSASAIAFTRPTNAAGRVGEVVYLAEGEPTTPDKVKGKIVLRDLPTRSIPYTLLLAVSHYSSPDFLEETGGSYSRTYLTASFTTDIEEAAAAGAVGFIRAFDLPTAQVRGYYSSHNGTLQAIPGVWVGADEREQLEKIATDGGRVRIGVKAKITPDTPTRNLIATLPGQSAEKIVLATNSDGNSWVQENGTAAFVMLARYLASLPLGCRPKTIEFVASSAHLGYNQDGFTYYIKDLEQRGQLGDIFFGMGIEHLGAREVLMVPRTDGGPGRQLTMSGEAEPYSFFAPTESPVISTALIGAVQARGPERTGVLRGLDVPPPVGRIPVFCSFGGLANEFQFRLVPSIGGISGPETMWNSIYGVDGLDFEHMRRQTLVLGDTLMNIATQAKAAVEGAYPQERAAVAAGAETCDPMYPKLVGPGTPAADTDAEPPVISRVRFTRSTRRLRFRITEPARTKVTLQRRARNGKWVAVTSRTVRVRKAGASTVRLRLTLGRRTTYRLRLVAVDAAGNRSKARTVRVGR